MAANSLGGPRSRVHLSPWADGDVGVLLRNGGTLRVGPSEDRRRDDLEQDERLGLRRGLHARVGRLPRLLAGGNESRTSSAPLRPPPIRRRRHASRAGSLLARQRQQSRRYGLGPRARANALRGA